LASAADLAVISGLVLMRGSLTSNASSFTIQQSWLIRWVFPTGVSTVLVHRGIGLRLHHGHWGGDGRTNPCRPSPDARGYRYHRLALSGSGRATQRTASEISSTRGVYGSESARIEAQEDIFYGQIVCITARW